MRVARAGLAALVGTASFVLAACVGSADAGTGIPNGSVPIAGGGPSGIYYGYGGQLAEVISEQLEVDSEVAETGGSVENLDRIAAGESLLAFTAADAASDAVAGRPPFSEPVPVQAVARVYDDFVHLVVAESSSIESIEDLRGRNVSLGAVGSGTELIARRVLAAAGVSASEMKNAALGIDGSVEALRSGGIDAFFWSGGLPTPGVSELAGKLDIRLVELGSVVDGVRQVHGGAYRHGVVPEGMYGLEADIATMAVPNYLVVHADVSDELAYDVTRLLFEHRSKIAAEVPAAALLDRPRAIFTEPVELHEGALAYYRDTKL